MKIHACSTCTDICCERTTYRLTKADLARIPVRVPTILNTDGSIRLPQPCPFLDPVTKKCDIYQHRPLGCRIYPVVWNEGITTDRACPGHTEIPEDHLERYTIILESYFHQIRTEAKERLAEIEQVLEGAE